ncbi:MAG: STAS/SEC14 domain-containing protein [Halapricum sp.]
MPSSERALLEWSSEIADRVTEPEIEYFEQADIGEAWDWVDGDQDNGE